MEKCDEASEVLPRAGYFKFFFLCHTEKACNNVGDIEKKNGIKTKNGGTIGNTNEFLLKDRGKKEKKRKEKKRKEKKRKEKKRKEKKKRKIFFFHFVLCWHLFCFQNVKSRKTESLNRNFQARKQWKHPVEVFLLEEKKKKKKKIESKTRSKKKNQTRIPTLKPAMEPEKIRETNKRTKKKRKLAQIRATNKKKGP